ncbi:hypothetical protein SAMN02927937_01274 [Paenimyroides aquimaris]|uniref:SdiA-regulated family protein n=1 Tax=Paenimyroides marinum TaxID=1159016 RepID=A0A1H6KT98_9FLAO|nr:hypothetical protein [Paenimyroides aquimaris]SEH76150.1 hypothetical protein SAMN02927937_01274 [Paenimyroides aquimaris]
MKKASFMLFLATLTACQTKSQVVDFKETFALDKTHKEVSGMVFHEPTDKLWMLQDKGNPAELYAYTTKGTFVQTLKIINQENTDWEDLSQDKNGNLYIGNFGNNDNKRQDLRILKIDGTKLNESVTEVSQITTFTYEDQKDFPPKKSNLLYDCEAFVTTANYFYLFTKNRSKGFDGTFYVYKIPNRQGSFIAKKIATLKTCENYKKCAVTGAAMNKAETKIALSTHDNVFLIDFKNETSFTQANIKSVALHHNSQKEALTFLDDETLLIADEKEKGANGGKVYTLGLH